MFGSVVAQEQRGIMKEHLTEGNEGKKDTSLGDSGILRCLLFSASRDRLARRIPGRPLFSSLSSVHFSPLSLGTSRWPKKWPARRKMMPAVPHNAECSSQNCVAGIFSRRPPIVPTRLFAAKNAR